MKQAIPEITRPAKVLFPQDGITKGELVEYSQRIAPVMLPYLKGRPIARERYPDGIANESFFQKRAGACVPDWIKTAAMALSSSHSGIAPARTPPATAPATEGGAIQATSRQLIRPARACTDAAVAYFVSGSARWNVTTRFAVKPGSTALNC